MTRFLTIRTPLCKSERLAQTLSDAEFVINTELQLFCMSDLDFLWPNKRLRIIMESGILKC